MRRTWSRRQCTARSDSGGSRIRLESAELRNNQLLSVAKSLPRIHQSSSSVTHPTTHSLAPSCSLSKSTTNWNLINHEEINSERHRKHYSDYC